MSITRLKQRLGMAANPMANDFRLRPNHRCYPPSYPHLLGGGGGASDAAAGLAPVGITNVVSGHIFFLAQPVADGTEMVFLNGILLEAGEDYDLQGDRIKIHSADERDTVRVYVAAAGADTVAPASDPTPAPDPFEAEPVPLDEVRYTSTKASPLTSTNKNTALIGSLGAQLQIAATGAADTYHYYRLSANLVALDGSVFYGYQSLVAMRLPDSVERLGNSCFQNSSLQRLDAGRGLRALGYSVFKGAEALRELVLPSESRVPEVPNLEVFAGTNADLTVRVPRAALEAYRAHPVWHQLNIQTLD